jgi:uncharacterized Ntn-hydrolase superfamily protein
VDAPRGTYSIVAADPETGEVGAAVQSRYFAVGAVVPWARAGVGAVATQALGVAAYGPRILALLESGARASDAIEQALAEDGQRDQRQLGVVSADGTAASWTGPACNEWAGDRQGTNYAAQGNILAGEGVVDAMASAFEGTDGDLAERLMAALEAAEAAGGDRRGRQSAAVLVERAGAADETFEGIDTVVDLRVDDHPEPIEELRRLLRIHRGMRASTAAFALYQRGEHAAAADQLREHVETDGEQGDVLYNLACFEALAGRTDDAVEHLKRAVALDASFGPMAADDSDFDSLRDDERFRSLVGA